jgi:hypothetical protein
LTSTKKEDGSGDATTLKYCTAAQNAIANSTKSLSCCEATAERPELLRTLIRCSQ